MDKYQRQMLLPEWGEAAQSKLGSARILVVGAGGLGCPVLLYLAAMGAGHITIIDFDVVEMSNLHRQVLFGESDLGQSKSVAAARKLKFMHSNLHIEAINEALSLQNVEDIVSRHDLVIDGSDNFPTRYLVNDACLLCHKPLVHGAVYRFEGQVAVFNHPAASCAQYRDMFPEPPQKGEVPSCSEAGVLGVLPGIIGTLMVNEAIKIITGIGEPLANKMLIYNSLYNSFYEVEITPFSGKRPSSISELSTETRQEVMELDWEELPRLMAQYPGDMILIDVREENELPKLEEYPFIAASLSEFDTNMPCLSSTSVAVAFCQSGMRSKKAAARLKDRYPLMQVYSLKGGIMGKK